jgi:hypothetical protein
MTLKKRILFSVYWLVLIFVLAIGTFFWIAAGEPPSPETAARASMAGSGFGILASIGFGILWLPYAFEVGKRKREQQERAKRKKSKTGNKPKSGTRPKKRANTSTKKKTQTRRKKRPQ